MRLGQFRSGLLWLCYFNSVYVTLFQVVIFRLVQVRSGYVRIFEVKFC